MIISRVRWVGLGRQILQESLQSEEFRGGVCRVGFGRCVECRVGGEVGGSLGEFASNVLSLSGFPWLKNLSQKCLFLNSLVFRELAGLAGWTLKKLKRRGRERKREEETKRQRDKKTKRLREEGRGRGERAVFLKHECSWIFHELTMNCFLEHDCSEINETFNGH